MQNILNQLYQMENLRTEENSSNYRKKLKNTIINGKTHLKTGLNKLNNLLNEHYLKILTGIFEASNITDYLVTADGWSKGLKGEKDPTMLKFMVEYGPYAGGGIVAAVEGILQPLYAYTGYKIAQAIPELHKYPKIQKIWPSLILIYGICRHINGIRSWL